MCTQQEGPNGIENLKLKGKFLKFKKVTPTWKGPRGFCAGAAPILCAPAPTPPPPKSLDSERN